MRRRWFPVGGAPGHGLYVAVSWAGDMIWKRTPIDLSWEGKTGMQREREHQKPAVEIRKSRRLVNN